MRNCKYEQTTNNFKQNYDKSAMNTCETFTPHSLFKILIWLGTEEALKKLHKTTIELNQHLESSINYGGI